jgi:EmrB/QacA subfamily drug resistance transporter
MDAATPPAVADAAAGHARALRVLGGVMLCVLLAALDQTVVVPAVPAIAADLNGFGHLAWIVTAYLLTGTTFTPIYGKLSDIYGRRALLLPAIVLFVAASVLCALARDLTQLIAFRALQGVGGAGLLSMAQASIADVIAPRERGRYQAYLSGMWGIASVAGPVLGGWMADQLSWRWIFWVNVPLGAAAFVLSSRALRALAVRRRAIHVDYLGAALLSASITLCLLALSWGGAEYPWISPEIMGAGGMVLVLLAALALQERRAIEPLLPPRLLRNPVFVCGVLIGFLASAAMLGGTFLLPLYFQLARGVDAATSGTLLVPFLISSVLGAYLSGQAARKLGRLKLVVVVGLGAAVLGFTAVGLFGVGSGLAASTLCMVLMGMGLGSCMPSSLVISQNAAERRDIGAATGTLLLLRAMGAAFGSTIAGAMLAAGFAARLTTGGVTQAIDLGALRAHGGALARLDPAIAAAVRQALMGSFQRAFLGCAVVAALGLVVALAMRDQTLRSSSE